MKIYILTFEIVNRRLTVRALFHLHCMLFPSQSDCLWVIGHSAALAKRQLERDLDILVIVQNDRGEEEKCENATKKRREKGGEDKNIGKVPSPSIRTVTVLSSWSCKDLDGSYTPVDKKTSSICGCKYILLIPK